MLARTSQPAYRVHRKTFPDASVVASVNRYCLIICTVMCVFCWNTEVAVWFLSTANISIEQLL